MSDSLPQRCEVLGWQAIQRLARTLARRIAVSGYQADLIVAIGRGGYVPGRILSDWLGQTPLTSFGIQHYRDLRRERAARVSYPLAADVTGQRVLLVDDVADSGETFALALRHLAERGPPAELRSAVLHYKTVSCYRPDYFAARVRAWRWIVYPWAVAEDIGSMLRALQPPPHDVADAAQRLAQHGVRLPSGLLSDLLMQPATVEPATSSGLTI